MKRTHVIYTNSAGAPAERIKEGDELYLKVLEIGEQDETPFRYAHYYCETEDEYGLTEYVYLETTNA